MKTLICSERAENVLKQAKNLVKSLEEADEAQQKAKEAIKQANVDISLARDDLEKVKSRKTKHLLYCYYKWTISLGFFFFLLRSMVLL